jgi:hypothetical protein
MGSRDWKRCWTEKGSVVAASKVEDKRQIHPPDIRILQYNRLPLLYSAHLTAQMNNSIQIFTYSASVRSQVISIIVLNECPRPRRLPVPINDVLVLVNL